MLLKQKNISYFATVNQHRTKLTIIAMATKILHFNFTKKKAPTSTISTKTKKRKKRKKGIQTEQQSLRTIPKRSETVLSLAIRVLEYWVTTSYELSWTSKERFADQLSKFNSAWALGESQGSQRPDAIRRLKELDQIINGHIGQVKNHLIKLMGRQKATNFYKVFGMVKIGESYRMPRKRSERINSLEKLVKELEHTDFSEMVFGKDFWIKILEEYKNLLNFNVEKTENLHMTVAEKNQYKSQIRLTLRSLVHLLKANYPTTWKQQMKLWGFWKERTVK